MKARFYPGFITYDFGDSNFLFVDVHPTTSLEIMPREDIGADLISVRLAQKFGGKAIITMMPRDREYGMDLNRLPTPESLAVDMFNSFMEEKDSEGIAEFEKKYAWVAATKAEHAEKEKIYNSFWSTVGDMAKTLGRNPLLVFVHVQDMTIRNFPSAIDVIPLVDLDDAKIKKSIEDVNKKYKSRFEAARKDVADFLVFDVKHQYKTAAMQTFASLDTKKFSGNMKERHEKMLQRILDLGFDDIYKALSDSYSFEKHIAAAKIIGDKSPLRITHMMNFTGELALATKEFLKKTKAKALEVEVSVFLSEIYTDLGTEILENFIKTLV